MIKLSELILRIEDLDYKYTHLQKEYAKLNADFNNAISKLNKTANNSKTVFEYFPDLIFSNNKEGICIDCYMPSFWKSKVDPKVFIGKKAIDFLPSNIALQFEENIKEAINASSIQIFKFSLPAANGERYFESRITSIGNNEVLTMVRDITEEETKKNELIAQNFKNNLIFNTISEAVSLNEIVLDSNNDIIDYRILEVNQAFYQIAELDSNIEVNGALATVLLNRSSDLIKKFFGELRLNNAPCTKKIKSPNSNKIFLMTTSQIVDNKFVRTFIDITSIERDEQNLRINEARFNLFADHIKAMGWEFNANQNKLTYISPRLISMLGYQQDEVIELQLLRRQVNSNDKEKMHQNFQDAITKKLDFEMEFRFKKNDGDYIWLKHIVTVFDDDATGVRLLLGITIDINEIKNNEEKSKEQNQKLQLLIKEAKTEFWEIDYNRGKVNFEEPKGIKNDIFTNTSYSYQELKEIIHPEDRDRVIANVRKYISGVVEKHDVTFRIIKQSGLVKWLRSTGAIIQFDENNRPSKIAGLISDITESIIAEHALFEKDYMLHYVIKYFPGSVFWKDLNSIYLGCNSNFLKSAGLQNISEIVGKSDFDLPWSECEKNKYIADDKEVLKSGEPRLNIIETQLQFDGSNKIFETNKIPLRNEFGEIVGILGTSNDITTRKEAEKTLQILNQAFIQNPICIMIANKQGFIEYINPKTVELTEYSYDELIGNNPRILSSGNKSKDEYEIMWKTISSGHVWNGEFLNKKKNGILYWENSVIAPIMDESGLITHYVAVKEDITERKAMINELIESKERAVEGNRLKSEFLSNLSHEIRTPINGIIGFTHIIVNDTLNNEERREYAELIDKSCNRLINTVDDIVEISKIDSKQIEIQFDSFDIQSIILDLYDVFYDSFINKDIDFKIIQPSGIPGIDLYTDKKVVYQILNKILDNALKFTISGSVEFGYNIINEAVEFYVKDTGIGIEKDAQSFIFEKFSQEDGSISRNFEGSGLGLAIAKGLVEYLGGNITVESEKDEGSIFRVSIPILRNREDTETAPMDIMTDSIHDFLGQTILIVEDDPVSAKLLEKNLLLYTRASILIADNGMSALNIFRSGTPISLILMDIRMRGMDGFETTKLIREQNPNIPIIAVTAHSLAADRNAALQAGCNDYLTKPYSVKELIDKISITMLKHIKQ